MRKTHATTLTTLAPIRHLDNLGLGPLRFEHGRDAIQWIAWLSEYAFVCYALDAQEHERLQEGLEKVLRWLREEEAAYGYPSGPANVA